MATIIANPCSIPAIPRNGVLNPKIVDKELVMKHLDRRFIANLGIRYYDRMQNRARERSDDALPSFQPLNNCRRKLALYFNSDMKMLFGNNL